MGFLIRTKKKNSQKYHTKIFFSKFWSNLLNGTWFPKFLAWKNFAYDYSEYWNMYMSQIWSNSNSRPNDFFQNSTQFHIFVKFEWKWTKWTHIDTQSWSALNFDPCFLQSIRTRPPPACQRLCVHICHNPGLYFISSRALVVSQYSGEIYSISLSFLNGFWSNWHFWIHWKIEILAVYKTCTFHIWLMRTKSDKSCLFSRQNRS